MPITSPSDTRTARTSYCRPSSLPVNINHESSGDHCGEYLSPAPAVITRVLLSVSGTALTSHMENDGGGGAGSFVLIANPGGGGGDAANIFLVRDSGPGYSIELDRTLTLEPGRYRISARLDNTRGSSEIDFGFDVGPQGAR